MYKVLIKDYPIPEEHMYLLEIVFKTFYGLNTDFRYITFEDGTYLTFVVNINPTLGKKFAINLFKNLGCTSCYFIKNDVLYKKWLDTGIVDKLGLVECINGVDRLTFKDVQNG